LNPLPILPLPLIIDCRIIARTSLFTVEAEIAGRRETVYLGNTGRLRGIIEHGKKGFCIENKSGKLKHRLIGVEKDKYAYLVDTLIQERAFIAAHGKGLIPWLRGCSLLGKNYRLSSEIIDYAFKCNSEVVLVELKSAVMELESGFAGYPDAPTPRGRRQLEVLAEYALRGGRAFVVFIAGVPNPRGFKLYCGVDQAIKRFVDKAVKAGVVFKSINIFLDPLMKEVVLGDVDLKTDLDCEIK
jgi:sugar fermentation stimulation protein A